MASPLYKVPLPRNLKATVFRIRHAAKLAGINPTLLRAWERRYHLVEPRRTPSGYRVYSQEDVDLLRAAARLVAAGHTISEVARLPAERLLAAAERTPETLPAANDGAGPVAEAATGATVEAAIGKALDAIARFDRAGFEAALFPLSAMAGLGPVALCERVLLPLLRAIGDRWERGELTVAAEHFGSALCRARIIQYLEFVARAATGPRVICACPDNEQHEGGLLAFAVRAAVAQYQVIYLGAHTPAAQVFDTAARIAADLVALSLTVSRAPGDFAALLAAIEAGKRARPQLAVLAGGREALVRRAELEAAGVEVAAEIDLARVFADKSRER